MKRLIWLFILGAVFSNAALAFRCGHELVDVGDYQDEVYEKCGQPDYANSHWERKGNVNQAIVRQRLDNGVRYFPRNNITFGQSNYEEVDILVEEWTYHSRRNKFGQRLRFENGLLKDISSLSKRR
jgi:hypothetical protein